MKKFSGIISVNLTVIRRFFIILRGSVSVMIKDQPDDLDLGDETLEARQFERPQLGNAVVQLRMYYQYAYAFSRILLKIYI